MQEHNIPEGLLEDLLAVFGQGKEALQREGIHQFSSQLDPACPLSLLEDKFLPSQANPEDGLTFHHQVSTAKHLWLEEKNYALTSIPQRAA